MRGIILVGLSMILISCTETTNISEIELATDKVTDIDGNEYNTIQIGSQVWMAENLRVTRYRNGQSIPNLSDSSDWQNAQQGAYVSYDNDSLNISQYGLLYNGFAAIDDRNIAPEGWRVATDEDWKELEIFLGIPLSDINKNSSRGTDEGGKLKAIGPSIWDGPNTGANNNSFFTALPGGLRKESDGFSDIGLWAWFWSSSVTFDERGVWQRGLNTNHSRIDRGSNSQQHGMAIRCIKETTPPSKLDFAKIKPNDGSQGDIFGFSLSIDNTILAVSAKGDADRSGIGSGTAYAFERNGSSWIQRVFEQPDSVAEFDEFGRSISCSDEWIIVGAIGDDYKGSEAGAAYIFRKSADRWIHFQTIRAPNGIAGDLFGIASSIDQNRAVVGAYQTDRNGRTNSGSAYVYQYNSGNEAWEYLTELRAPFIDEFDSSFFGISVDITGDQIIVGASNGNNGTGLAYVFEYSGVNWVYRSKLISSNAQQGALFGASVAIENETAIVGAPKEDNTDPDAGAIYFFSRENGQWQLVSKFLASDSKDSFEFGGRVALAGNYAVVGSTKNDENGSNAGAAYLFGRNSTGWGELTVIFASDGAQNDIFANFVAIHDNTIVVGAQQDDDNGENSGSVYIYSPASFINIGN